MEANLQLGGLAQEGQGGGRGAHGLVVGWAGHLSVLAPWGCDCGGNPWAS